MAGLIYDHIFLIQISTKFFRMAGDGLTVDSDMSTSINSDASLDIDIVRHHDGRDLPVSWDT